MSRLAHTKRLDLQAILQARLDWKAQQRLDEQAPAHLLVPSGSRLRLDYSHEIPVLAVRLQELFGLAETPSIAGGRVPLLLHLLSPARRPVQITQDLAAFWQGSYHEVRKELKGRYPKHHWPDDPLAAQASDTYTTQTGDLTGYQSVCHRGVADLIFLCTATPRFPDGSCQTSGCYGQRMRVLVFRAANRYAGHGRHEHLHKQMRR